MDFDDYEMKEREQEQEREQERVREESEAREQADEEAEQETNFDDIEAIIVDSTRPVDVDLGGHNDWNPVDDVPNVGKDVASIKRSITNDVKRIFKDIFNMSIEKKNGKNSKIILENTRFIEATHGRISIEFKGSRIGWVNRNLNVELFEKKNKKLVQEFKDTMDLVRAEYEKSPSSLVRNLPEEVVEDILDNSVERISDEIEDFTANLSEQELREFAGVLDPKGPTADDRIKALEAQADHWKKARLETKDQGQKSKLESLEKTALLQADNERLKNNEKPIHDETLEIIDDEIQNNDLSKLERFKEWARKNFIGFSVVAISIAGIVTTVVIAGRKAVKSTAKGVGKLAKALVNVGNKIRSVDSSDIKYDRYCYLLGSERIRVFK